MTNIEKLYELAKVEKKSHCDYTCNCRYLCSTNCTHYNEKIEEFPPFTAEKQLKLIRWIQINKYKQYLHFVDVVFSYFHGLKFETEEEKRKFVDSEYPQRLAKLVCELWDDLTPEQQMEIKRILE